MKPSLIGSLTVLLACATAAASALPSAPATPKQEQPASEIVTGVTGENMYQDTHYGVLSDYRHYYTGFEPLAFRSISTGIGADYGVTFVFASNQPGFLRLEASEDGVTWRPLPELKLFIPLLEDAVAAQEKHCRLRALYENPAVERYYALRLHCMTRKAFAASGGQRNRDIIKLTCEPRIDFGERNPRNWKTFKATETDIAFARKRWGHLLEGVSSDYERAKILSKALVRDLQGKGGLPSALIYGLKGFEKYEAIMAGKSKFACAQFSEIFSKACNCFGIINRWGFLNDGISSETALVEIGSSHLVTEIFDRQRNQWIFIDGHQQALGAFLGEVGPLTAHEFMLFINQPYRRPSLRVLVYEAETDQEKLLPVDQCTREFLSYRGWSKGFHTTYRQDPSVGQARSPGAATDRIRERDGAADRSQSLFGPWPSEADPRELSQRVAYNFAARPFTFETGERDFIFFAETCAWHNALRHSQRVGDAALQSLLTKKYDLLLTPEGDRKIRRDDHVDYCCFGAVQMAISSITGSKSFRGLGLAFADRQWEQATPDGLTKQARYWVDDLYAIGILQGEAYRLTNEARYLDRTAQLTLAYMRRLQQPNGLFFHSPDSPLYWARGNGWVAAGLAMLLRELPAQHPLRERLLQHYRTMMAALLQYQGTDGLWRQLLDKPDFWPETSGSGLFTFALATGVRLGWLDKAQFAPAVRAAWLGLARCVEASGDVRGVCDGTNTAAKMVGTEAAAQLEYYRNRKRPVGHLHGVTAILLSASAL